MSMWWKRLDLAAKIYIGMWVAFAAWTCWLLAGHITIQ